VLRFLAAQVPAQAWLVTRASGDDWVVMASVDDGYGLRPGSALAWGDTICARMVAGRGPRIAPDVSKIDSYSLVPQARLLPVGSYVGVELTDASAAVFGTLCALDPEPRGHQLTAAEPLVTLQARLLSGLLAAELSLASVVATDPRPATLGETDQLTGVLNSAGWDRILLEEDQRIYRCGLPAALLVVRLDEAVGVGKRLGQAAADQMVTECVLSLRSTTRASDAIARIGPGELAVLLPDIGPRALEQLVSRVRSGLERRHLSVTIGAVVNDPEHDLNHAYLRARTAGYHQRRGV
jgi:diguanylate cyclase (GGDEF)-like protein